jgi:hypothetical protein
VGDGLSAAGLSMIIMSVVFVIGVAGFIYVFKFQDHENSFFGQFIKEHLSGQSADEEAEGASMLEMNKK